MTIGGVRIRKMQFAALSRLQTRGQVVTTAINLRTAGSLMALGLIEIFVPEATSLTMAERGRTRYYRLTTAGESAINGLKAHYPDADKET